MVEEHYVRMRFRRYFLARRYGIVLFSLLGAWLAVLASETVSQAQTTLNVTNFGARGDAVQFFANTTSNSVVVTTTNHLSNSDIGKVIELFGAGPLGTSTNHQDLLATITNVVNATNLYISRLAGATTNNCYGVYGQNNASNFQACINGAPSNSIINIPNGTYLIIGSQALDQNFVMASMFETHPSVVIQKGGLTLLGQSESGTVLLGCGAWQNKGSYAYRGHMFGLTGPVTNNGPLIFDSLTIDGGVRQGFTGDTGWPANTATGDGWDVTHDAVLDEGTPPLHFSKTFRNCHVMRWRGEQLKSVVGNWDCPPPGPAIVISNCVISDGDATALNFSFSHVVENCTFSNLDEIEEFYEGYATNTSVMQNCFATNVVGALMAMNGALTNSINPTYTLQSNVFYMLGQNGIQTTPAQNVVISHNTFIGNGGGTAIALGTAGYQGSAPNSNIVVSLNTFTNIYFPIEVEGSGQNAVYDVQVVSNTASTGDAFAYGYGWSTNVIFIGNTVSGFWFGVNSTTLAGEWYLDDLSNQFPTYGQTDNTGATNTVSYMYGMRHQITANAANSVWVLDDTHPRQVPPSAALQITSAGNYPAPLYSSASMSGTPIVLTNGEVVTYLWTNGLWANITSATNTPVSPAIQVMPGNIAYGIVLSGSSKTNSFTVQNVGGGTLNGAASVGVPFSILSGGSYSLGSNQSQTVTVVFSPTVASNYNQSVTFTGGNGTNTTVTGSATNAPVILPILQVTPGSIAYGTLLSGTSKTNSFMVQNVGGGTLSGTASVGVPFSILSGGSYSLASNQSQAVMVVFSPSIASNYSQSVTFTGGGGTNAVVTGSATNAPVNPAIHVTPGSIAYGTVLSGTSATNSFTVQNVGGGTLSGTASVGMPFSILSGGSYSLGSNQSQTVTVVFSPVVASNYNQSVTFTGGSGTNVTVTGSATNAPASPVIQVTPVSIAYGTVLSGTSKTNSFTVRNVGTGTLSGTAGVGAPFTILSGGSYSLGSNQSQTVTVAFSPTVASNYNQSVTFTGGGGTNTTVAGSATSVPPVLPAVSAISVNATAVDTNAPGLQIYPATTVQLSATATNALTWQWSYTVNGGSPVIYTNSTSPVTNVSFYFDTNTVGNSYIWTLVVSNGQAWAESQTNFGVEDITQGPAFTATSGTLSGLWTAQSVINGVLISYIYQPLPSMGSTSGGTAVYNFTITKAGNYEVQALVNAPSVNANSFYVNIDGQPQISTMIWDIMPVTSGFQQRIVSWRGNGSENNDQIVPKVFSLNAGPHQIILAGREPGTGLASFTLLQVIPATPTALMAPPVQPPATPENLRIISSSP
jgi:hypothetical protein